MSSDDDYRDILYGRFSDGKDHDSEDGLAKPCTVGGCGGVMHFKPRLQDAPGQEWPWLPTWVCREDSSHFEIATVADERRATEHRGARRRR